MKYNEIVMKDSEIQWNIMKYIEIVMKYNEIVMQYNEIVMKYNEIQ